MHFGRKWFVSHCNVFWYMLFHMDCCVYWLFLRQSTWAYFWESCSIFCIILGISSLCRERKRKNDNDWWMVRQVTFHPESGSECQAVWKCSSARCLVLSSGLQGAFVSVKEAVFELDEMVPTGFRKWCIWLCVCVVLRELFRTVGKNLLFMALLSLTCLLGSSTISSYSNVM